jgi:hypothetical protein
MMEAMFSQRNIHEVLHRTIAYQLDKKLLTWALGCYLRIDNYLSGEYYESKNKRIDVLKAYLEENNLETILIAVLASVIRGKRDQTIQQCLGYLEKHLPHENVFDRVKTAGELLALCGGDNRIFQIRRVLLDSPPLVVVNNWNVILELFEEQLEWIDDTFYNPPLVEKPKKVSNNHSCGYHTINEPLILGRETHHDHNVSYDVVNMLNDLTWYLDGMVLTAPEKPPKPLQNDTEVQSFIKHVSQSRRVYEVLGQDPFWLSWQFDSRGRVYSHGHHVNFQSHEYKKAMLSFGDERVITV